MVTATASTPAASPGDKAFFGHPRGLATLFFTEMWERFSYYGMRAILMLFMTTAIASGGLGFKPEEAGPIYAMYTSLVYLVTIPGGRHAADFGFPKPQPGWPDYYAETVAWFDKYLKR